MSGSPTLALSAQERDYLARQLRRANAERGFVARCAIVLRRADGGDEGEIAAELGVPRRAVAKWCRRFERHRIDGLLTWRPRDFALVAALLLLGATVWAVSVYSHVFGPAAGAYGPFGP